MYRIAIVFLALVGTSLAQRLADGKCPNIRVVRPFIATRFEGSWYEWARHPSQIESETKCNAYTFSFHDGRRVAVNYSSVDSSGKATALKGSAILPDPVGRLNVTIPGFGIKYLEYYIVGTDYSQWAAVFACRNLGNQHERYLWFVTRSICPSAKAILAARNAFNSHEISLDSLEPVNQQNCYEAGNNRVSACG